MTKLLASLFGFLLAFSTFANTNIETSLQELDYFLTVEWDQKNMHLYDQQIHAFADSLTHFSQSELKDLMIRLSNGDEALIHNMFSNIGSNKDLVEFSLGQYRNTSLQGASWNGTVKVIGGFAVVALAVAGYYYYAASQIRE